MLENLPNQKPIENFASPKVQDKYINFCKIDENSNTLNELSERSCVYYFQSHVAENKSFLVGLLSNNGYKAMVLENGVFAIRNDVIALGCNFDYILNKIFWPSTEEDVSNLNIFLESEIVRREDKIIPLTREDEIELISDFF